MGSVNAFEDLSGVSASASDNPYDALIEGSRNDPVSAGAFLKAETRRD